MQNLTVFTIDVGEERWGGGLGVDTTGNHLLGEVSEPTVQNRTERGLWGFICSFFSHWNEADKKYSISEVGLFTAALPWGHWTPILTHVCVHCVRTHTFYLLNSKCHVQNTPWACTYHT